ncbi:MAG: hypothetical protein GY952_01170, partial [Rhodobacteraceae bacterium]|nr:hypothetical protein [Paracoccaceae bacterium]
MSQILRSFEANSGDYLTKMIGKSNQKGFSAVSSLISGSLLALFPLACGVMLSVAASAGALEDGRAIYFEGIRSNGTLVSARVAGGALLQGELAACVRCHRPSGYGSGESNIQTAEIAAPTLFKPLAPRRDRLLRSLYQERYGPLAQIRSKTPRVRPAYSDAADILKAVQQGIDTAGEKLSLMMPR